MQILFDITLKSRRVTFYLKYSIINIDRFEEMKVHTSCKEYNRI